jgi:hypothetical protein
MILLAALFVSQPLSAKGLPKLDSPITVIA